MPHQHDAHCGHESTEHDHDHSSGLGPKDNLFSQIDRDNVVALNASGLGSTIIKPWHERLDEEKVSGFNVLLELSHIPFRFLVY
jgi:hypothetical protein